MLVTDHHKLRLSHAAWSDTGVALRRRALWHGGGTPSTSSMTRGWHSVDELYDTGVALRRRALWHGGGTPSTSSMTRGWHSVDELYDTGVALRRRALWHGGGTPSTSSMTRGWHSDDELYDTGVALRHLLIQYNWTVFLLNICQSQNLKIFKLCVNFCNHRYMMWPIRRPWDALTRLVNYIYFLYKQMAQRSCMQN